MHEVKSQMEANEKQPEMQLSEQLVVHATGCLGIPVIASSEEAEQNSTHNHVMKVSNYEIRIRQLPIEGGRAEHDPGESSEEELEQKSDAKQHGRLEVNLSSPHCGDPVKDFDSCWNSNHHRGQHKKGVGVRTHADGEHVVCPHAHTDESDPDRCRNHHRIPEYRLPRKHGDDFRRDSERWNDQNVDLGMTEDPEEVHPDHGRTASLSVEKISAEIAVNGQHDLRVTERSDGQNDHPRHHQVEPNEERHLPQFHAGTTQAHNRHDDVDRGSDTPESRNEQTQGPEIRAVTG